MANNTELIGDAETLLQILKDDFSETEGRFEDSNVVTIRDRAFNKCESLQDVYCPACTSIGANAFTDCHGLRSAFFPNAVSIGASAFSYAGTNLSGIIVLPKASGTLSGLCNRGSFSAVDLGPDVTHIQSDCFYTNTASTVIVQNLILRRTDDCVTVGSSDTIKGARDVYVPTSLISSYQSANYWSTNSNITFHAIEGSIYENAYADGTPIT